MSKRTRAIPGQVVDLTTVVRDTAGIPVAPPTEKQHRAPAVCLLCLSERAFIQVTKQGGYYLWCVDCNARINTSPGFASTQLARTWQHALKDAAGRAALARWLTESTPQDE